MKLTGSYNMFRDNEALCSSNQNAPFITVRSEGFALMQRGGGRDINRQVEGNNITSDGERGGTYGSCWKRNFVRFVVRVRYNFFR
ncbi:MAG: hypothetical protein LBL36_01450, partial [Clostridiales Family XIII bacterium]|nr:hypothetical protein [Clostridiales Family XIII bacterium]